MELLPQLLHRKRNREEIKGIPRPAQEPDEKKHPLLEIEQRQEFEWVRSFIHRRFEGWEASRNVGSDGHVCVRGPVVGGRLIARGVAHLVVVVGHCYDWLLERW